MDADGVPKWRKQRRGKRPAKPYPEFPLYAHPGGQWAKRIRYEHHYFGPWADPHGALERYLAQRDYLLAGIEPPGQSEAIAVDELVNRFLAAQRDRRDGGDISARHYADLVADGRSALACLGRATPVKLLGPEQFARLRAVLADGACPTLLANRVARVRRIFNWARSDDVRLIAEPPRYGGTFSRPSARTIRLARRAAGPKLFDPDEVRRLLKAAEPRPQLRAMILLGVNAGLGNADCAALERSRLDLPGRILDDSRPKTGVARRAALWPETVRAVRAAMDVSDRYRLASRRGHKFAVAVGDQDLVFLTACRRAWVHVGPKGRPLDAVGRAFGELLRETGLHRRGIGFYTLRRTFRTVADETRDFPAVDLVMGHVAADAAGAGFSIEMADRYRQRISDERLRAVAECVRRWLFGPASPRRKGNVQK